MPDEPVRAEPSGRPLVVQFGAGAVGRGFMGQLWTEAGYRVLFIDVRPDLVDDLNQRGEYPLRLVGTDGQTEDRVIAPISAALLDEQPGSLAQTFQECVVPIRECAFVCTAVGVAHFPSLLRILTVGISFRSSDAPPLNILCCENQADAAGMLRSLLAEQLMKTDYKDRYSECFACVNSVVGRMVPPPSSLLIAEDPLLIQTEPYRELPIDADAWKGPIPDIPGLQPKRNFAAYVARKLYTHNGGHALLAYMGYRRGHAFLWECAEDPALVAELEGFWRETGAALMRAYGFPESEQREFEADLLHRFRNRALGDTVFRVARDPARKLASDDRLVGAARLCLENGITPAYCVRAIAAALRYDHPDDAGARAVRAVVERGGVRGALSELSGLPPDSPLVSLVESAYNEA